MTTNHKREGNKLTVYIHCKIDTSAAPVLEEELITSLDGVEELVLDLSDMNYISSAGLRVFLIAQKRMNAQGKMTMVGVNKTVEEIFDITGLLDIFTIQ
ncbi:MAG: STAS domain-containing protein [Ruminococcus sp.]|nr:STAS domain-containing protein [Ruminococcus sp.]